MASSSILSATSGVWQPIKRMCPLRNAQRRWKNGENSKGATQHLRSDLVGQRHGRGADTLVRATFILRETRGQACPRSFFRLLRCMRDEQNIASFRQFSHTAHPLRVTL